MIAFIILWLFLTAGVGLFVWSAVEQRHIALLEQHLHVRETPEPPLLRLIYGDSEPRTVFDFEAHA